MLVSIFLIIYVGFIKPFKIPFMNKLELFNEVTILVITYHLLLFTNFNPDPITQYYVGYSIMGVTLFNILGNISIILIQGIYGIKLAYLKLKRKIILKCFKKKI